MRMCCIWNFCLFIFHRMLPFSKTALICEVNKCMQQVDFKPWAPNLILEAKDESMLLKWPRESCHTVWKYTKTRGKCPVVVIFVYITTALWSAPRYNALGSCVVAHRNVCHWQCQGRACTETGWSSLGHTGNSALEIVDMREFNGEREGSSCLLVGKGLWVVHKAWGQEQPSYLCLYGWNRKWSGQNNFFSVVEKKV